MPHCVPISGTCGRHETLGAVGDALAPSHGIKPWICRPRAQIAAYGLFACNKPQGNVSESVLVVVTDRSGQNLRSARLTEVANGPSGEFGVPAPE